MRLFNYDTNEQITDDASPELCSAACESDTGVFGMWSESSQRWELIDESHVGTLRQCIPEPCIVPMYGMP
jgi:hypothetical protein